MYYTFVYTKNIKNLNNNKIRFIFLTRISLKDTEKEDNRLTY